jgi:hypothetical protein
MHVSVARLFGPLSSTPTRVIPDVEIRDLAIYDALAAPAMEVQP